MDTIHLALAIIIVLDLAALAIVCGLIVDCALEMLEQKHSGVRQLPGLALDQGAFILSLVLPRTTVMFAYRLSFAPRTHQRGQGWP